MVLLQLLPEEIDVRTEGSESVVENEKVSQVAGEKNNSGDGEVALEHILELKSWRVVCLQR